MKIFLLQDKVSGLFFKQSKVLEKGDSKTTSLTLVEGCRKARVFTSESEIDEVLKEFNLDTHNVDFVSKEYVIFAKVGDRMVKLHPAEIKESVW